jgi:mRNA-degrading endonuclease RelE of RelBE toxin-antitoxin system
MKNFKLVFDEGMIKQLRKASNNNAIKKLLSKILNKIEELGPRAGKLIDAQLHIYEIKVKSPPIRLYYKYNLQTNEIYVFEYEMKTSEGKQNKTIEKIRKLLLKS